MRNKHAIILLFVANSVSGLAQGISMIAIPWYFNDVLQNPSLLGFAYGVITFLTIFWSSYSGTLIDKYSRKSLFLTLNLCGFGVLSLVAVSGYVIGQVPVPLILLVFASTFFIFNVHYPNLYALVQEITVQKDYARVNAYLEIQGQMTTATAGACAALLLGGVEDGLLDVGGATLSLPFAVRSFELYEIFALNAVTYLAAFLVISYIRYTPVLQRHFESGNVFRRIKSGLTFLYNRPLLLGFGVLSHNIFVIVLVKLFFIFSVYVHNHLEKGGHIYAMADMSFAIGALFAGIAARRMFAGVNTVTAILINLMMTTGIMIVFSITYWVPLVFGISFLLGLANSSTRILRVTYIFNHVPNQVIGRTNSVFTVINTILRMIFILLFSLPFFGTGNNIIYAYWIFGFFAFGSFLILAYLYPRLPKN